MATRNYVLQRCMRRTATCVGSRLSEAAPKQKELSHART